MCMKVLRVVAATESIKHRNNIVAVHTTQVLNKRKIPVEIRRAMDLRRFPITQIDVCERSSTQPSEVPTSEYNEIFAL